MEKQLSISYFFNATFSAMSPRRPQWRRITIIVTQKQSPWHRYKNNRFWIIISFQQLVVQIITRNWKDGAETMVLPVP